VGALGSLLRLEQDVVDALQGSVQLRLTVYEPNGNVEESELVIERPLDRQQTATARDALLGELLTLASERTAGDELAQLFAQETAKGVRLVEAVTRKYDVIVMNPPYGDTDSSVRHILDEAWKEATGNLFACFVCVGIMFGDVLAGVDVDDGRSLETGELSAEARETVATLDSYGEVSPSGTGVHVLVYASQIPQGGRRRGNVELYGPGSPRFFTVTGNRLPGTPTEVQSREAELAAVHAKHIARQTAALAPQRPPAAGLDDEELLRRAGAARNGVEFRRLWTGDATAYSSPSEADLALCSRLAFWCGPDAERIDRLFRQSGLMRDKWERADYRDAMISKAVLRCAARWQPGGRPGPVADARLATESGPPQAGAAEDTRPIVQLGDKNLHTVTEPTVDAIIGCNDPPELFVRAGELVQVDADEGQRPIVRALSEHDVRGIADRAARFVRWRRSCRRDGTGEREPGKWVDATPPMEVIRDIAGELRLRTQRAGECPLPSLAGVTECPVVRADGTVLDREGYDRSTKLYYRPAPDLRMPTLPEPTEQNARRAAEHICALLADFPFTDQASRANACAGLLTPIVRPALGAPTPLCVVSATRAGTGKTLLVNCVALIATGRLGCMFSAPTGRDRDAEWDKRILSSLLAGSAIIAVDGVTEPLRSGALGRALSTTSVGGRLLGTNTELRVENRAVWYVTGNNIELRGDLPRRCYWVTLDATTPRPEKRTGFAIPDLAGHVGAHRGGYLGALLAMVRSWLVAGRPTACDRPILGGFQGWADMLGGILRHAGIDGFLANADAVWEASAVEDAEWSASLAGWHQLWPDESWSLKQLVANMTGPRQEDYADLRAALPSSCVDGHGLPVVSRIGYAFRKRPGTLFPIDDRSMRLVQRGTSRTRAALWAVEVA